MHTKGPFVRLLGTGTLLAVVVATTASAETPLTSRRVATGLSRPVFVTAPPGDSSRVFIVEQRGSAGVNNRADIHILHLATDTINATPFLTVTGVSTGSEQGLLGMAFAPDYESSGRFYVDFTTGNGNTVIARGTVSADPDVANPTLETILTIDQPDTNHNGGCLQFGPDGYLYISSGDGGGIGDPGDNGQDLAILLGKILRLDVSPDTSYAIPPDNPYVDTNGLDEIWAYGLRNPWRFSFDRLTGDTYIGDVGQGTLEEIDFEPADSPGGVNYGWRCREGTNPYGSSVSTPCGSCSDPSCPLTDPITQYTHSDGCSVTGGYVYRGCAIPDLRGTYFYSDYCSSQLWTFRYDGTTLSDERNRTSELIPNAGSIGSVVAFGEDARGELYICDLFGGEVFKIEPAATPVQHDINGDGDIRIEDYLTFEECLGAPAAGYAECICFVFDTDGDGDVDLRDFSGFQSAFTGP